MRSLPVRRLALLAALLLLLGLAVAPVAPQASSPQSTVVPVGMGPI